MSSEESIITQFYTAFAKKDFATMQAFYYDEATFSDEVFQNLSGKQAGKMWEMLLKSGKDLSLEFSDVRLGHTKVHAKWIATYTFSLTGRKVVNHIRAEFQIIDGKIMYHRDRFQFHAWARQAFGGKGFLFGGFSFFKNKVRDQARRNLERFISQG